jgi:hypothetical protein
MMGGRALVAAVLSPSVNSTSFGGGEAEKPLTSRSAAAAEVSTSHAGGEAARATGAVPRKGRGGRGRGARAGTKSGNLDSEG